MNSSNGNIFSQLSYSVIGSTLPELDSENESDDSYSDAESSNPEQSEDEPNDNDDNKVNYSKEISKYVNRTCPINNELEELLTSYGMSDKQSKILATSIIHKTLKLYNTLKFSKGIINSLDPIIIEKTYIPFHYHIMSKAYAFITVPNSLVRQREITTHQKLLISNLFTTNDENPKQPFLKIVKDKIVFKEIQDKMIEILANPILKVFIIK